MEMMVKMIAQKGQIDNMERKLEKRERRGVGEEMGRVEERI